MCIMDQEILCLLIVIPLVNLTAINLKLPSWLTYKKFLASYDHLTYSLLKFLRNMQNDNK